MLQYDSIYPPASPSGMAQQSQRHWAHNLQATNIYKYSTVLSNHPKSSSVKNFEPYPFWKTVWFDNWPVPFGSGICWTLKSVWPELHPLWSLWHGATPRSSQIIQNYRKIQVLKQPPTTTPNFFGVFLMAPLGTTWKLPLPGFMKQLLPKFCRPLVRLALSTWSVAMAPGSWRRVFHTPLGADLEIVRRYNYQWIIKQEVALKFPQHQALSEFQWFSRLNRKCL